MARKGAEKSASLAGAVRSIIEREPYVRDPLGEGLINYSALARSIAPRVEKELNRKVKEESLIVAIKRYADEINGKTQKNNYMDIIASSTLSMQDGVSYVLIRRSEEVMGALESLINEPDWHPAEVRVIVEGPERTAVVLNMHRMKSLMESVKEYAINFSDNNALISMREPIESRNTYGVIAEIASVLSKKGISIELISAPPDLHFLVKEEDAEETYKSLRDLIRRARQAVEEDRK